MPAITRILVVKQTSLGDVLHATGHVRALKQSFPRAHVTLLTAAHSADIFRRNPNVDELILLDYRFIKVNWRRRPLTCARRIGAVIKRVRARRFDLAFDLQGLARSVLFLYAARAKKKYVKGNWPGLIGARNPNLRATAEMDLVLARAGLGKINNTQTDTAMEWFGGAAERRAVDALLARINPRAKPLLVFSPFSRWASKDWPLARYVEVAARMHDCIIVFTAEQQFRADIESAINSGIELGIESTAPSSPKVNARIINLAGQLTIAQFAELVGRAKLLLSGDSFPMHVACAKRIPLVALFGPTDAARIGPPAHTRNIIIRAPGCRQCDRAACRRGCMRAISTECVVNAVRAQCQ